MLKQFCLVLTVASLQVASVAFAENPIGLVVSTDGTVSAVNKAGESRALSRRSPLFAGDSIKVAAGGRAQIKFSDSSLMSLQQNTEFKVDSYRHDNATSDEFSASLVNGGLRTITGAISKARTDSYKVSTPVASMGVRGTFYACSFSQRDAQMTCEYFQGSGVLQNSRGQVYLGADGRYNYGSVSFDGVPVGQLEQPESFEEMSALEEGGAEPSEAHEGQEGAIEEEGLSLENISDDKIADIQVDIDAQTNFDPEDSAEISDMDDAEDIQTELVEDHLED